MRRAGAVAFLVVAACGSRSEPEQRASSTKPTVTIHVEALGLTAEEVEALAVLPIERALARDGHLRAVSTAGHAVVTVALERGVEPLEARLRITEQLAAASLPNDAHVHLGAPNADHRELYVLRSDRLTMAELRSVQDWLVRPQLLTVGGVTDVVSCGGAVTTIDVAVQAQRLQALDVSIEDVLSTLSQSVNSAVAGYVSQGGGDVVIRGGGARIDDLQSMQLEIGHGHVPVPLRDVAEIARRDRPAPCQAVLDDGTAVVTGLVVVGSRDARSVRARMDELRAALPPGVQVEWLDPPAHFRLSTQPGDDAAMLQRLAEGAARTAGHAHGVEQAIALVGSEPDATDRLPGEIDLMVSFTSRASPAGGASIRELLRDMPGIAVRRPDIPSTSRLRLELVGPDRDSLAETAAEAHRVASSIAGVDAAITVGATTAPRRSLTMDRGRMTAVGITPRDITDAVKLATDGYEVGIAVEGTERIPIEVRWADIGRDPKELGQIPLRASNGSWVMMHDVASLQMDEAPVALLRADGIPSMTIWIELAADARGIEAELRRRIGDVRLGPQERLTID